MLGKIKNRVRLEISKGLVRTRENLEFYGRLDYGKHKILVYNMIRCNSCAKEPETVEWIEGFRKHDVAYDVGANIGAYSLIMSKYAREVYAFEPAVFNFNILEKNIIENYGKGLIENNVVPLNIALSSSTEIGSFNYGSLEEGTSVHMLGAAVNQHGRQFAPKLAQKMLAMRLDDMVKIFRAPVPNHIKIDVDGSELDVIRGAKETLLNRDVKSVLVEITYANRGQETRRLVEESGFELAKKSERSSEFANHIFFRK